MDKKIRNFRFEFELTAYLALMFYNCKTIQEWHKRLNSCKGCFVGDKWYNNADICRTAKDPYIRWYKGYIDRQIQAEKMNNRFERGCESETAHKTRGG